MASLQREPNSGRYRVRFRLNRVAYKRSIKTTDKKEAQTIVARIRDTIRLIERGRLEIPDDADPAAFVMSDGKRNSTTTTLKLRTLGSLLDGYRQSLPPGTKESTTLDAEDRHIRHLKRHLKSTCIVQALTLTDMQQYVGKRSKDTWRNKPVGPGTIGKELTTFRYIWNWGVRHRHLSGPAPVKGIDLPKIDEKPPFMTWDQIARVIDRDQPDDEQQKELWDCLFLRTAEIEQLLEHVRSVALHDFIYPMFVVTAHTGARRSEILRSEVDDFDLGSRTVLLREKKKSRKLAITFRRVPMTASLFDVCSSWRAAHPGGRFMFPCAILPFANGNGAPASSLSGSQATDHFKQTLKGSKWAKVRGFHVFRHSFASNCAAKGLDQRIIDDWMGHQTEEMRHRYRHLFPEQQRTAIDLVFGGNGK